MLQSLQNVTPSLLKQRVLLVTSLNGAKRRSAGLVAHILRNKLACTVNQATVSEPSVQGCINVAEMARRTQSSVIVGVGGSTVLDATKFATSVVDPESIDNLIVIPTIPCGGKEFVQVGELYDWEKEHRTVFQARSFKTIIDPTLAREDHLSSVVDAQACLRTLSVVFNQPQGQVHMNDNELNLVSEVLTDLRQNIAKDRVLDESVRLNFFKFSERVTNEMIMKDNSVDASLANILNSRLALPRSLVRLVIFRCTFSQRISADPKFAKILKDITQSTTPEGSVQFMKDLFVKCETPTTIDELLKKISPKLDRRQVRTNFADWVEEAVISESQYRDMGLSRELALECFGGS